MAIKEFAKNLIEKINENRGVFASGIITGAIVLGILQAIFG